MGTATADLENRLLSNALTRFIHKQIATTIKDQQPMARFFRSRQRIPLHPVTDPATIIQTRCEYVPISSTAASLPQTVLITVAGSISLGFVLEIRIDKVNRLVKKFKRGNYMQRYIDHSPDVSGLSH
jgi:hypothetical protein